MSLASGRRSSVRRHFLTHCSINTDYQAEHLKRELPKQRCQDNIMCASYHQSDGEILQVQPALHERIPFTKGNTNDEGICLTGLEYHKFFNVFHSQSAENSEHFNTATSQSSEPSESADMSSSNIDPPMNPPSGLIPVNAQNQKAWRLPRATHR